MRASGRGEGAAEPVGAGEKPTRTCLLKQLRKTKFCMYYLQGTCSYGDGCAFAHHCDEVNNTPDLRKTRLCKAFAAGRCTREDCGFAHGTEELRSTDMFYKKTLCMWHQKGKCRNGDQCRFAHGVDEIRLSAESGDSSAETTVPGDQSDSSGGSRQSEPQMASLPLSPAASEKVAVRTRSSRGRQAKGPARAKQPSCAEPMFVQPRVEPMFVQSAALGRPGSPWMCPSDADAAIAGHGLPLSLGVSAFDAGLVGSGPEVQPEAWPGMASMSDALAQEITRALEWSPCDPAGMPPMGAGQGHVLATANNELQQLAFNIKAMSEQLNKYQAELENHFGGGSGMQKVMPYQPETLHGGTFYPGVHDFNYTGEDMTAAMYANDLTCMGG